MNDLERIPYEEAEHAAWTRVVQEWDRIMVNLSMNDERCDRLIAAIGLWGEHLASLRGTQDMSTRANAMVDMMDQYKRKGGEIGE